MDKIIDTTHIMIKTDRLILRAFKETDLEDFYEYARVEGVGEMAGWNHHKNIDESKKILDMFLKNKNEFAITDKVTGKVIGSVGVMSSHFSQDEDFKNEEIREIGYVISKDYWGKGIAKESSLAVMKYYFDNTEITAFSVTHFLDNNQSKRVIEKCGFKFIKNTRFIAPQLNKEIENAKYILLKKDFIKGE